MRFIKSVSSLHDQLKVENVRIVDCRFALTDPTHGKSAYYENHIPGAVFFDLEKDLSSHVSKHGGRHPLPSVSIFIKKLGEAGITQETTVVAYDDGEGAFAGRFWWLLSYLGHKDVYVLDGGYKAWKEADYEVTDTIPTYDYSEFVPFIKDEMLASYEHVKKGEGLLVDSRARERYLGLIEPLDARAGHIPGAINIEWTDGFENGLWKDLEAQKERFSNLDKTEEIIVYCGSGVTATPNILALKASGFKNVKLYAGSYSDWVSYDENPVETGENPKI
ncbi:sulfurtransferase [Bacillus sp. FJAT-49732]|uniref:Sulfurtransferase n=1 Tax=Lederbergia citrisecunda TaxID=2833583 RepID=A0A942TJR5_9BACI|nr:sulfurtransferase [Lederbergia citrisecunda]MBS4199451.1 sulfurtransferase [Lederbergia citrisecunda]